MFWFSYSVNIVYLILLSQFADVMACLSAVLRLHYVSKS